MSSSKEELETLFFIKKEELLNSLQGLNLLKTKIEDNKSRADTEPIIGASNQDVKDFFKEKYSLLLEQIQRTQYEIDNFTFDKFIKNIQ